MSKSKRYRAAGKHWKTVEGQLVTGPFPGAKTVEDIGRMIKHNRGKAIRHQLSSVNPLVRTQVRTWLGRLRKSCIGGEFKRLLGRRLKDGDFNKYLQRTRTLKK